MKILKKSKEKILSEHCGSGRDDINGQLLSACAAEKNLPVDEVRVCKSSLFSSK